MKLTDLNEGSYQAQVHGVVDDLALEFAQDLKLDKAMLLGRGEEKSGGRRKRTILAGVFEAVVGGVYCDGGFEAARALVTKILASSFRPIRNEFLINNFKSALQEAFQKDGLPSPDYRTLSEKGPPHDRTFVVEVAPEARSWPRPRDGPGRPPSRPPPRRPSSPCSAGR
jgi:dsRNA-specific ribonuclease